jgi:CRISPR/Cas system-associated exonuclease Cas4 (RecB family)
VAIGLLAALFFLSVLHRARRTLPRGTVIYSDADGQARPLISPLRPLSGKPDYVLRVRRGEHVPVELKSYRRGAHAPHADLIHLGAYLVLLEDLNGEPPPFGNSRYTDRALRVPYTAALRAEVLRLLEEVGHAGKGPPAGMPHLSLCQTCPIAPIREDASSWRPHN